MFQPEVKLEFVRRYCHPANGWTVYVDIDPSEEGWTGGERRGEEARNRQKRMQEDGRRCREALEKLGATVGSSRAGWREREALPEVRGDRDIVAFHKERRLLRVAEVEGDSSGQPEQKLYKAMGQLVMAASESGPGGWERQLVLVAEDGAMTAHLRRAGALEILGVARLALAPQPDADQWLTDLMKMPNRLKGVAKDNPAPTLCP